MNKLIQQRFTVIFLFVSLVLGNHLFSDVWQPPEQFTNAGGAFESATGGATDGNGNAASIYINVTGLESAYFDSVTETWLAPQLVSPPFIANPSIAMDATGTALAIWADQVTFEITTARRSAGAAGTWTTLTPDPLDTLTDLGFTDIAMNGSGNGVALWIDQTALTVSSSFFNGTNWNAVQVLTSNGTNSPNVAYSANGTAVAIWDNAGVVTASHTVAGVWQAPVPIGNDPLNSNLDLGIDASGNAIATWNDSGVIMTSIFSGGVWGAAEVRSVGSNNSTPSIGVAPGGTAVLTWADGDTSTGLSVAYNGSTWGPFIPIASNVTDVVVSVDSAGNALALYGDSSPGVFSVQLPVGGAAWGNQLTADANAFITDYTVSALSDNGRGFAFMYLFFSETTNFEGAALIPSIPPVPFSGTICNNKFATQTDHVHILSWIPSTNPNVVAYYLRRNGQLIAIIPATGPFIFFDHNRCRRIPDVYVLTTINALGVEGSPSTVVLD